MDEASTESTPAALPSLLAGLRGSLDYPVVIDRYGQLADGYGVQDQPWVELVSGGGKILLPQRWLVPRARPDPCGTQGARAGRGLSARESCGRFSVSRIRPALRPG